MKIAGDKLPNITVTDDRGQPFQLPDQQNQWMVLYFYPKDDTPGCTKQACAFRDADFSQWPVSIIGVSKDSVVKHQAFKAKYQLPFTLLSDQDGQLCDLMGVIQEKSMYGKTYLGIVRSTFLIDPTGQIQYVWPKVRVPGHVESVLKELGNLIDKQ